MLQLNYGDLRVFKVKDVQSWFAISFLCLATLDFFGGLSYHIVTRADSGELLRSDETMLGWITQTVASQELLGHRRVLDTEG